MKRFYVVPTECVKLRWNSKLKRFDFEKPCIIDDTDFNGEINMHKLQSFTSFEKARKILNNKESIVAFYKKDNDTEERLWLVV